MYEGMQVAGSCGSYGSREDSTIIEMGLALLLWNQDLSNGWGQSARQKIEYMRGGKESGGREGRRVRMKK